MKKTLIFLVFFSISILALSAPGFADEPVPMDMILAGEPVPAPPPITEDQLRRIINSQRGKIVSAIIEDNRKVANAVAKVLNANNEILTVNNDATVSMASRLGTLEETLKGNTNYLYEREISATSRYNESNAYLGRVSQSIGNQIADTATLFAVIALFLAAMLATALWVLRDIRNKVSVATPLRATAPKTTRAAKASAASAGHAGPAVP